MSRHKKPVIKQALDKVMRARIRDIKRAFPIPMFVTIVARNPISTEAEVVFSDDDFDGVIEVMQRRRDGVVASQKAQTKAPEGAL